MPSQQSLRRDNTGDLFELPKLDLLGLPGQSSPLFVAEAQALRSEVLPEHPHFLSQILNHLLLISVHPGSNANQNETNRVH
jgi:hypothetical protein